MTTAITSYPAFHQGPAEVDPPDLSTILIGAIALRILATSIPPYIPEEPPTASPITTIAATTILCIALLEVYKSNHIHTPTPSLQEAEVALSEHPDLTPYCCAITFLIPNPEDGDVALLDPTNLTTVYSSSQIHRWLATNSTSTTTRKPLIPSQLIPLPAAAKLIRAVAHNPSGNHQALKHAAEKELADLRIPLSFFQRMWKRLSSILKALWEYFHHNK